MINLKTTLPRVMTIVNTKNVILNCLRNTNHIAIENKTPENLKKTGNLKKRSESELMKFLKEEKFYSKNEWSTIKTTAISNKEVTPIGFDGFCMGIFVGEKNFVGAKSLMCFLESEKIKPNVVTLSRFMQVCSLCFDKAGEELILKIYEDMKNSSKEFDSSILRCIISGLSKTSKWKECLSLLESTDELRKPSTTVYNLIASAAFRNNEPEIAFEILEKLRLNNLIPYVDLFEDWIRWCKNDKSERQIDKLISYCAEENFSLSTRLTDLIKDVCEKNSFRGTYTSVRHDGYCENCKTKLEKLEISLKDFEELRDLFLSRVLESDDPYLKTNPKELKQFMKFIKTTLPFDVVLDGLNIGYFGSDKNKKSMSFRIINVINQLTRKEKKKILLLGKKHMIKWPDMKMIKEMAHVFFTENISKDDPFLLYAALSSGPSTLVVSRDMMRDHKFSLNDLRLASLFRSWQICNQISFSKNPSNGYLEITPPIKFNPICQIGEKTIHVPCTEDEGVEVKVINSIPSKWLCLEKKE